MKIKKFTKHEGIVLPINISNIDTDAIIPKQFLKKITKTGFGKNLFNDWRYLNEKQNKKNKSFILNDSTYKNSSILLTRKNFGCGSSREHAVWALKDYGFKVIIASSFADIFYINSLNNQLLLITLKESLINKLFQIVENNKGIKLTVNLIENCLILLDQKYFFKIDPFHKFCILNGLDFIDHTLQYNKKIENYEKQIPYFFLKN